jgi:hypothetical protein
MTDLLDFKPKKDTIEVILRNPMNGEPILKDDGTEMTITVYGSHSRVYRDAIHEQSDARIEKASKSKDATLRLRSKEVEELSNSLAAKITHSWDIVLGDEVPPVSRAEEIYSDFPWIRSQIFDAVDDLNAFLKP